MFMFLKDLNREKVPHSQQNKHNLKDEKKFTFPMKSSFEVS